ncbi:hypothetical protein Y1Q_0019989 [Alligator mississippiensis]|uniref:Uncharacterized protein n=1 Tax=Alligator mississippiensis TaxID=8496 RepID=A0A151PDY6_ALLMI|nr:hypothetical protein Y1Q_0019989 [Alligator mississippiensis]
MIYDIRRFLLETPMKSNFGITENLRHWNESGHFSELLTAAVGDRTDGRDVVLPPDPRQSTGQGWTM